MVVSEIRDSRKTYPVSRIQGSKKLRIPEPDSQPRYQVKYGHHDHTDLVHSKRQDSDPFHYHEQDTDSGQKGPYPQPEN
jgi:hypothetical protein